MIGRVAFRFEVNGARGVTAQGRWDEEQKDGDRQIDRQTGIQTDKQVDRQTDRLIDR